MNCPNCGGEVVSSVTLDELEVTVTPEGSVGVCSQCHQAVSLEEPPVEEKQEDVPEEE